MEIKVEVPFQQLLSMVKALTPAQKARLRKELDEEKPASDNKEDDFIHFLLNGPVYSDKDIAIIEENRKSIAAWRTKS
ncbi:hypothetical protein Q0590_05355 [Rhodocytophaga aerolata]|uniref:Uncharacterized protein n=1 Tax=Rhodocytophaga aerolata TaxID=455078 RepID=A0ABT8R0P9_9BACT|nr:hypothetical protein [Rhodocytophaga aerolata]MDO1445664.1 hypothetical protein [Rhodocytophaga aerolata]